MTHRTRSAGFACASVLLLGIASIAQAGENYAVLVAVGGYDQKHLRPLDYSRNDILEFADALKAGGFKPENVVLLHDDLSKLSDARFLSEADKILKELRLLLGTLQEEDTLVVGFAGHGVQFAGEPESYFCARDADLEDPEREGLISLSSLYDQLKACPARRKLLLVDACRNDPQSRLSRSREKVKLESVTKPQLTPPPQGVVALFSCAEGQEAYEYPDLKHGVFFYHVLQAWKGQADKDPELTLDELVAYTKRETAVFARTRLGALQTPRQQGFFDGEWVLRVTVSPAHNKTSDEGFESIFNGIDLTGWAGATDGFEVIDGMIRCRAMRGGVLYTDAKYSDFVVRLEFKLSPAGNSGLAIRYPGEGDSAYSGMCDIQILDSNHPKYQALDPRQLNGSAYGLAAAKTGHLRSIGEWNSQEVTVKGSTVHVELNGAIILDADLSKVTDSLANASHPGKNRTEGHFGISGHSDPVEYRNIRIKRLAP